MRQRKLKSFAKQLQGMAGWLPITDADPQLRLCEIPGEVFFGVDRNAPPATMFFMNSKDFADVNKALKGK